MSEQPSYVSYVFRWITQVGSCRFCTAIPYEIHGQDLFQDVLRHPLLGVPIWDLNADRSLMHSGVGTCRCQVEVRVEIDWEKAEWLQDFYKDVEAFTGMKF